MPKANLWPVVGKSLVKKLTETISQYLHEP